VIYALLIYRTSPASIPEAAHRALQVEAAGDLSAVARLDDSRRARTVKNKAGAHEISDGPFIETKEWLVGFYVLECATEEQAIERARAICTDESHVIEVRPVTWRWK
jgi:hypothetical protein